MTMYYRPKRWIRYWLAAAGLLCFGLVSLFFTTGAPPKSASPNLRRAQEVQPVDRSLWLLASRQALHPSLGLPMSDLEIFKQCYVRRISSTHDIAAMVLGKPIVVIASTPTCRSSSGVQLASNARRVWLCTAPSGNAPTAIASFTSARVLLSNGPADWVTGELNRINTLVGSPSCSTKWPKPCLINATWPGPNYAVFVRP